MDERYSRAIADGADCEHCYLSHEGKIGRNGPVYAERNDQATIAIVGEAPGKDEVEIGRPFVGASGAEAMRSITSSTSWQRNSFSWTNTVLCRPKNNDLHAAVIHAQRMRKLGSTVSRNPIEACAPRLGKDIVPFQRLITMGTTAWQSVCHTDTAMMPNRGGPVVVDTKQIMPTVHPAFVLRQRRWTGVFRSDLAKAERFFNDKLLWKQFSWTNTPTPELLRKWLSNSANKPVAFDIETDGIEPLMCNLRCIALATGTDAIVTGFTAIDGHELLSESDEYQFIRELKEWFYSPRPKTSWNGGYFDKMVIERVFDCLINNNEDGILLHRLVEGELPHSLGFVGSYYTDVTSWKEQRNALDYESDYELHKYCATDAVITAQVSSRLHDEVILRGQEPLSDFDHKIQAIAVGMHRIGMYVDKMQLLKFQHEYESLSVDQLAKIQAITNTSINPNSTQQVAELLYNKWHLPVTDYTDGGDPSVKSKVLRELLRSPALTSTQHEFVDLLRRYRRSTKYLGTFIRPIYTKLGEVDAERIHPNYNTHATVTGRFSSSDPNAQQFPKKLRSMVRASAGHILVGADMDQIELRLACALAGANRYLNVFRSLGDPHALTAQFLYGAEWDKASNANRKKLREFAKRFVYAVLYGAEDKTVYEVITLTEDNNGNLVYLKIPFDECANRRRNWLNSNPEFNYWWQSSMADFRARGYRLDPIVSRRRDFLDGENFNEIINFPVQAGASAIVHEATLELIEEHGLDFNYAGPGTGLIQQGHDALVFEVPEADAEKVAKLVQSTMSRHYNNLDVPFTATAHIGYTWADV